MEYQPKVHHTIKDPKKIDRIMQSALENFAEFGYQTAKMENIATDAGVSKGTVFYYFGSKAELLIQVLTKAIEVLNDAADVSVWSEAQSLTEMVTRSTRYKFQLELEYQMEFKVLLKIYIGIGHLPNELQATITHLIGGYTEVKIENLVGPILERENFRPELDKTIVVEMMLGIVKQIELDSQQLFEENADATMADFEPIIDKVMQYMDVLEHGYLAK